MLSESDIKVLFNECKYATSRSSGPGGQNVNKVNTKVELRFKIDDSNVLNEEQKQRLQKKLGNKINNDGELVLVSQESRSQLANKTLVTEKFLQMIEDALKERRKRKASKPTAASIQKRLERKRRLSDIKQLRRRID